jgi:hypothetical protein
MEVIIETLTQAQIDAAQQLADATVEGLKTAQGVHAETAIAGTARMAGTFLFRSFGFPLSGIQPGQIVLSDQANEEGPLLVSILGAALSQLGIAMNEEDPGDEDERESQPNLTFLDTQRKLEPSFLAIAEQNKLSHQEAAYAAAVATGFLIQQCSNVLDPDEAFDIAVYGFIEGTKTAPDPVNL